MAFPTFGQNNFSRESTSTEGWTPEDHIQGVIKVMGDEVKRLRAYVVELEAIYLSEFKGTKGTDQEWIAELRERYGVTDLMPKDGN